MNRSLFQAFLFLLVCSKGLLASPSSSASQLASIEPEPSVLICGCIHALTGDFLFQQPDMIVKGAQTIGISRKYYSSGPENSLEDQIVPHRMAWGFGFRDIIHLTRLLVPEPNGMIFSYLQVTPYVYQPISGGFQAGITGYLIDYLGNRYHPANNRASWPDDNTLHVKTSTGEVRVYEKRKFTNNDRECQFAFCLSKLRLANGTLIQYEYDKKNCLKRITAPSNARGKKEFSHAEVSQNKKGISIRGTDGSSLGYEYHKTATTGKKDKVKVLKYVRSSLYPSEKLKREKVSTRIAQRHFVNGRILTCEYDETGRVTQLTGPQGSLAAVGYDKGETNSFDREGNKTLYLYDPQTLRIIEIQSYQGSNHLLKTEKFTWTRFGCLERKTVLSGEGEELHTIHCTYNAHLDLTKKTISNGDESYSYSYEYNEQNLLQEESEESGRRTTYTYIENTTLPKEICNYKGDQLLKRTQYFYDDDQLLTCEITDDGATYFRKEISRKKSSPFYGMPEILSEYCGDHLIGKTRLTYDEYGNVTKTECYGSDGHLQTTTQTIYNEKGQVLKEIDPEGNTTEYRYDENGNLTWKKTPLGLEIHSIYDTANRLIEEKQIGSGQTLVTRYRDFDALDHPTKIIDPLGGITRRKYDALGNLTQETNPEGHTTQYIYDALGNVLSVTDPLGNTTITTYNLHNNPLCITHPDGNTEIYTYNPDGTKASYTNEVGRTTLYTYDIFNNISSEEIINGIKKTWTYDAFHLLQETNLDGYVTTYEYDELGRKTRETYEGRTTHYTYDSLSRVISEQTGNLRTEWTYNKLGHTTSEKVYDGSYLTLQTQTTYNAEGNPIEVTTYPNNQPAVAKTTYDVFGRVTCHTTPLGLQMKTSYQIKEGEKIITTQEIGRITQIDTYNALDQILQQERKDPFGKVLSKSEFTYDRCGNCIEEKCSIHTISTTYDNRHRKITETESGQKTTHYTYTPDSKLETQTKPDGTKLKHTYNDLGHRIALQSSKGDIHYTYSYDNRGNLLLSRDLIYQIQTKRIVDPHGEILKETLGNSHTLTSRYDELGRRTQLALPDKTISYTHLGTYLASVIIDGKTHSYTYDQSGNLIKEQHIDGSTTEYTYDADSRLIHRKHPKLDEILEYDARGNLIKLTRNGEELQYSYDYFDHLIEEPDHNYQYDILHNRIKKDDATIDYNALNQEVELDYDSNGNLLSIGSYSLEYDSLDRLVKVKTWFTATTYTYDNEHRRILENSTPILWDGQHELGEPNYYRILGIIPFAEIGSAVAINDHGKLLQTLHTFTGDMVQNPEDNFTAFGEGSTSIRWGYQSKVHDPTGLIYFGRRYYNPDSGRFVTSDPEGYIDGPNLYAYTLNNPLTHHDPYGLYLYLNKDHFKEMATGLYHGSLSYARDTALFASKYLGGIHGPDDMPFSDIYSAHLDAGNRFTKKTDNWMASSPYATGDLYQFTRGATYTGMDFAGGFLFPFGQMKLLTSTGKALHKAGKAAQRSQKLLKSRLLTSKLFKSSKNSTYYRQAVDAARPATSSFSGHLLKNKLIAEEISSGHAFTKHVVKRREFPGFSQQKFQQHLQNILNNPSEVKTLTRGRTGYWDKKSGTVIIRDPAHPDGGTAFRPLQGEKYFDKVLK